MTHDRSNDSFLNYRPSHLQKFTEKMHVDAFMNRSSGHDAALRERDAEARQQKLYPSTQKMRDVEPKASPEATLRNRHRDEINSLNARHHSETQQLLATQTSERNKRLQTSHSMPARLDDNGEIERSALHDRHRRDREALDHRHLVERDRLRAVR
jgi:hypothetical protein